MTATTINSALDFDASARLGMSKIETVAFRAFAFGVALLKVSFPSGDV
jgi:hypothetical protein